MDCGFRIGQFVKDVRDKKEWLVVSDHLVDGQVAVVPSTGYRGVVSYLVVENLVRVSDITATKPELEQQIESLWSGWWNVSHKFDWDKKRIIIGLNYGGDSKLELFHDGYEWGVWEHGNKQGFQTQYYFELVYRTLKLLNEVNVYGN